MIIYGWNAKNIKQADLEAYQCPKCGEKQSAIAIFAHYAHIFWIPVFPFKKSANIICGHCQLDTEEKQMPSEMKDTIKRLKSTVSMPKSLFSGLVILILAVAFFSFRGIKNAQLEESYLEKPQIGDVYIIKDPQEPTEYDHYLFKIIDITDDSLWVSFSAYNYNGVVSKLEPEDGFYDVMYSMHEDVLKEFDEQDQLKKVIREYSPSSGFDRVVEYVEPDSTELE